MWRRLGPLVLLVLSGCSRPRVGDHRHGDRAVVAQLGGHGDEDDDDAFDRRVDGYLSEVRMLRSPGSPEPPRRGEHSATIGGYFASLTMPVAPDHATLPCSPRESPPVLRCRGSDSPSPASVRIDKCLSGLIDHSMVVAERGGVLRLTARGAKTAAASSRSESFDAILLDHNPAVARIAAAAAVSEARLATDADELRDVATACEQTLEWLEVGAPISGTSALTCLVRAATGLSRFPTVAGWGGCSCGERGRQLGDTCFETLSTLREFGDAPIDARIPELLADATRRANENLAEVGITIQSVGLIGCHFPRLERGATMRGLDKQAVPQFSLRLVSTHTSAAACDISRVWTNVGGVSIEMMYWSLLDESGDTNLHAVDGLRANQRRLISNAGGEGRWFRSMEHVPADTRFNRARRVGVALRNALVDAGFVVYTPVTNATHRDHLHVTLPREPMGPDMSPEQRELEISAELAHAAGLP